MMADRKSDLILVPGSAMPTDMVTSRKMNPLNRGWRFTEIIPVTSRLIHVPQTTKIYFAD
jgi:hypothetical protein